ncbi:MAG: hypothetical protein WC260_02870 [Candidatus Pacearchaeota archaeon]
MIAVIRIAGQCKLGNKVINTFERLKLGKKYSCILIDEKDKIRMGMVNSIKNFVTFGEISENLIKELKEKRDKGKGVFFLHPPRGGLKKSSKLAYPKGILGKNNEIDKLLERML